MVLATTHVVGVPPTSQLPNGVVGVPPTSQLPNGVDRRWNAPELFGRPPRSGKWGRSEGPRPRHVSKRSDAAAPGLA